MQDVRDSEPLNAAAYQVFLVHYQEGPILFLPPQYSYDKVGFDVHFDTLKECWGAPFTKWPKACIPLACSWWWWTVFVLYAVDVCLVCVVIWLECGKINIVFNREHSFLHQLATMLKCIGSLALHHNTDAPVVVVPGKVLPCSDVEISINGHESGMNAPPFQVSCW